jgi:hypothetical protein
LSTARGQADAVAATEASAENEDHQREHGEGQEDQHALRIIALTVLGL